jgi:hypothetical protein
MAVWLLRLAGLAGLVIVAGLVVVIVLPAPRKKDDGGDE